MDNSVKKARIWELDAFRGLFIICMVVVHILYDLINIFEVNINPGFVYKIASGYGSILFIVLSGICATLGTRFLKRGLTVLGFGICISLVMGALTHFFPDSFGPIYFGILHLLGVCMLLSPLFKKMPLGVLCGFAVISVAVGFYIKGIELDSFAPLTVLGFRVKGVWSLDLFPIFPNVGYFAAGVALGKTLYKEKKSLLPEKLGQNAVVRFFRLCGRYSLHIYVLHQPIAYSVLWLILNFNKIF